jgi:alpha-mannosidase
MTCTYSIYPHKGAADLPTIYGHAYALNNPMTVLDAVGDADRLPISFAMTSADCENVLCETVKEAEDSTAHIFRYYECSNTSTHATLKFGFDVESVVLCNMSEEPIRTLEVKDNAVELDFGAFEIHTLAVTAK